MLYAVKRNLHSATLRRTAAVVRNRGNVAVGADFNTSRCQCTHRRFAARSGTGDADINRAQTMIARLVGSVDRCLLRGKRSPFTRPAEAERTRTLPRNRIALTVGDGHNRVVERSLNVNQTIRHILAFALLELLVLGGGLSGSALLCFCH